MNKQCPICGQVFSILDVVLSEHNTGYQCHRCWNRVRATGSATPPVVAARRREKETRRRK